MIIQASTSVVYVNTSVNTNAIVFISSPTYFGETISIRDIGGYAATFPITISTTSTICFNTLSSVLIQQSFGGLSFTAASSNLWNIQNTFGYKPGQLTEATLAELQVSSLQFIDSRVVGAADFMTTIGGILQLNGSNVISIPNNFSTISTAQIFACNVSLSDGIFELVGDLRLTTSGTAQTNFLTLIDYQTLYSQMISAYNSQLYTYSSTTDTAYQINPIGGAIEFNCQSITMVQYPLWIGSVSNLQQGWWLPSLSAPNAFITYPGFSLTVWASFDYDGFVLVNTVNNTNMPIYSEIGGGELSYSLVPIL